LAKKESSIAEEKLYAGGMFFVCKTPLPLLDIIEWICRADKENECARLEDDTSKSKCSTFDPG
jgi:hypothetical protein